ncbi:substrate-binding domain-containing protein [Sinorhizobium medicae]|nr:substrate-binding domain-containing protein [Sinorhizobium medicae]MDX0532654.1 substrate-binding domain-containing protein [Sinorhizobium medicae]MDX0619087.1 substrate-binding domain-containing protein [Sinorhizobium medicae]MDX0688265.1 substrate-binding domain-containing protein [Sinorhizobium medicae]MDX0750407.1 substrate-binding domain-containing protein [Sinorhizobium medicae]
MLKKLAQASLAAAVSAIALLPMLGAAPAVAQEGEDIDITIGWVPPDITGVFKTATNFFELAAQDANKNGFNVKILTRSPTSPTAFAEQVSIIEDMIQRKVDLIAVSPAEVATVKPALVRATQAGIPVVVVNLLEPIDGVDVSSYIGFDNTQGAEVSAYSVVDYFGGPGVLGTGEKVDVEPGTYLDLKFWEDLASKLSAEDKAKIKARGAIIEGVAGGFFSTARLNGFRKVLEQFPGIEIVGGTCAGDWNREKGTRCAEDILQGNQDDLDFIWAASNEMGLGAMLVAGAQNRLETTQDGAEIGNKKVAIFTNDVTPESVDRIAEGKMIAETTHGFADWGWFGTKFAVELACGLEVPKTFDIRPRSVYEANARNFYPEPKLESIDWKAIRANCKKAD